MSIAVAVSGGTDSTFALVLLRDQGLDVLAVHGYFLRPTEASYEAAGELSEFCETQGVPFLDFDLSQEFEKAVVAPFISSYAHGMTPNPCCLCNPALKFGMLFDAARQHGATRIATGHYARITGQGDSMRLMRGADPAKDQSYFLSLVQRSRLALAELPLGDWTKQDVRAELDRRGITPPLPSESQEICFIPGDDYCAFLQNSCVPLPGPGPIMLSDGSPLGTHQGLWRYTQGQRRGIGVAYSEPLYVLDKDITRNALIVGPEPQLQATGCRTAAVNYLVPPEQWPDDILAQTRYRQRATPVRAYHEQTGFTLQFLEPQIQPAPGQVATVYGPDGAVLAGGIIILP